MDDLAQSFKQAGTGLLIPFGKVLVFLETNKIPRDPLAPLTGCILNLCDGGYEDTVKEGYGVNRVADLGDTPLGVDNGGNLPATHSQSCGVFYIISSL